MLARSEEEPHAAERGVHLPWSGDFQPHCWPAVSCLPTVGQPKDEHHHQTHKEAGGNTY